MSTVVVRFDGVDITPYIEFHTADFVMYVNGQPGGCSFTVKDVGHDHQFITGKEITVDVDGVRVWGGYSIKASRVYAFDVDNTTVPAQTARLWRIEGLDYNVLLQRRVVYMNDGGGNPLPQRLTWYGASDVPAGTSDASVVSYIVNTLSDLPGDGVTTSIVPVTTPYPDQAGALGTPGWAVGQALTMLNQNVNAIFYIDANKVFHWHDADTAASSYVLTDNPAAGSDYGYRELAVLYSASDLANDIYVWGAGTGTTNGVPTFSHATDATSVSAHGAWQTGDFRVGIYHQDKLDQYAAYRLNGTPQTHRGLKDDKITWQATLFTPTFFVGDKVLIESDTFGISEVVPIRRMHLTFPTPTDAKFDMTLTHERDQPWGFYEFWFPNLSFVPVQFPWIIDGPPVVGGCDCGITDTFDRTVAGGWGTSDSTITWIGGASVDGAKGILDDTVGDARLSHPSSEASYDVYFEYTLSITAALITNRQWQLPIGLVASESHYIRVYPPNTGGFVGLLVHRDGVEATAAGIGASGAVKYSVRIHADAAVTNVWLWQTSTTEPGAPTASVSQPFTGVSVAETRFALFGDTGESVIVDNLDITGVNRCTEYRFDNFNRTVSATNGWGSSDGGYPWTVGFGGRTHRASVDGIAANIVCGTALGSSWASMGMYSSAPIPALPYTVTARSQFSTVASGTVYFPFWIEDIAGGGSIGPAVRSGSVVLECYPNSGSTVQTYVAPDGGSSGVYPSLFAVSGGVYYLIKMNVTATTVQMRIWRDGDPEPTGWASVAFTQVGPDFGIRSSNVNGSETEDATMTIDYIDFDYAGKACYGCGCSTTDTFSRSVSYGWGTSDINGLPWRTTNPGVFSVTSNGGENTSVSGAPTAQLQLPLLTDPTEMLVKMVVPSGSNGYVWTLSMEGGNRGYYMDITRNGTSLDIDTYGTHGSGYAFPPTLTGQLTGFAGNEFYVRMRATGTVVSYKWWLASGSEPGSWSTSISPNSTSSDWITGIRFYLSGLSSGVLLKELTMADGFQCGGGWSGGGADVVTYLVQNKYINHTNDADYYSFPTGLRMNYQPVFYDPPQYSSTGVLPHNSAATTSPVFVQREWIQVASSATKTLRFEFDPDKGRSNYGNPNNAGATTQVALFADYQPKQNSVPWKIVAPNLDIDVSGVGNLWAQPWAPGAPATTSNAPFEVWWAGYGPGAGDPSYPPGEDPGGRLGYEPIRIVVTSRGEGAAWAPCSPVLPSAGSDPLFGYICELDVRGGPTTFQLSAKFYDTTTEVWVDNYPKLPGIGRDYTEQAVLGRINFNDPVNSNSTVRVCYQGAGPL